VTIHHCCPPVSVHPLMPPPVISRFNSLWLGHEKYIGKLLKKNVGSIAIVDENTVTVDFHRLSIDLRSIHGKPVFKTSIILTVKQDVRDKSVVTNPTNLTFCF